MRVRACGLTSRFYTRSGAPENESRTAKTAVQNALRQAQLQSKDLQVVDVNSGAAEHLRDALEGAEISQPQDPWSSASTAVPSTGWSAVSRLSTFHLIEIHECIANAIQYTNSAAGPPPALHRRPRTACTTAPTQPTEAQVFLSCLAPMGSLRQRGRTSRTFAMGGSAWDIIPRSRCGRSCGRMCGRCGRGKSLRTMDCWDG